MKGTIQIEVSQLGVAVSADLSEITQVGKMEIMHAVSRALNMTEHDMTLYSLGEHLGVFKDAETVFKCETSEQMSSLLRGEQPCGTVINMTELRRQMNES